MTLLGIVLASVVDLQLTTFGANFARNSKFCIRVAILAQFRDSVPLALLNACIMNAELISGGDKALKRSEPGKNC